MTAPFRAGPDPEEREPVVAHGSSLPVLPRVVLSRRELQVIRELCSGKTRKEVGRDLGIAPETVRQHCANVYRALGVASLVQAARVLGYLTLPQDTANPAADRIRLLRTADVTAFSDTADLVYREDVLAIVEGRG